jgi:nucleoside-diphosphate-sugar epimerase
LGIEIAKSLLEQGGSVIIVDKGSKEVEQYLSLIDSYELLTIVDYSGIETISKELRRLDYVFYLDHQLINFEDKISTQEFLQASNYLDAILDLTAKFDAKFLLTTAIKAHQQAVASRNIDYNYSSNVEEKYSIYTELDIQRYAESLVKEYQEKVGIDARILRLGTLLGKGMELNVESNIIKLIVSAINSEPLNLPGDGLESDSYIYYLDAAYGIIKAQFTPNTKGKIFSCANEEDIPLLSVAYKLLEINPKCQEIKFNSADNSLPPLKFYKPAPNLITIGWKPRVSFERALAQTVSFLEEKIRTTPNINIKDLDGGVIPLSRTKPKTFFQKIVDFFFVPDETPKQNGPVKELNTQGALARLISERKNQSEARQGNIILANTNMKDAKNIRNQGFFGKINRSLNNMMFGLKRKFDFFKNLTLIDFFFLILGVACLGIIYFQLIAPGLSLGKNIYFISTALTTVSNDSKLMNFEDAKNNALLIKSNVQDAQQRLSELEFVFILLQKLDTYKESQIIITDLIQYATSLENVYSALSPYGKYINEYKPNFIYRLDNSKYLSVDNNNNYKLYLQQITNNKPILNIGVNSMEKVKDDLITKLDASDDFIKNYLKPQVLSINAQFGTYSFLNESYDYIPYILGKDGNRKVAILLQDNLLYTDGGGEMVGYAILDIKDGVIIDIKVVNLAKGLTRTPIVSEAAINNLKFTTSKSITASNIQIKDLSLLMDKEIMFNEMKKVIELSENTTIDLLLSLNTDTFKLLLKDDKITVNSVEITGENYINSINLLIGDLKTTEHRNDILINIFAKLIEKYGNEPKAEKTASLFNNWFSTNTSSIFSTNLLIKKYVNLLKNELVSGEKYFIGMNNNGLSYIPAKMPSASLTGKITIKKDFSETKNFMLNFNGLENMQNATFCSNGANKNYQFIGVEGLNYTQVFAPDQNLSCILFLPDEDQNYQLTYDNLAFDKSFEKGYNKIIQFDSSLGSEINYDIEVVFEDITLTVETQDSNVIKEGNAFIFRGSFNGKKQLIFDFK